jgi:fructose-1-phosphate kinase PfkB-like protein
MEKEQEPLTDADTFRIRTNIIDKLIEKNTTLREQTHKIEEEIHLNRQIISQLREITSFPFQAPAIDSPKWKRLSRKLQAGVESQDPSKMRKTT